MERKLYRLAAPLAAVAVLAVARLAAAADPPQMFLTEAIQGDLGEIKLGQLAQEKGASQAVRELGQTLEQDHSTALHQATQVAEKIGMDDVPKQTSAKKQQAYERLSKLSGQEFDREFVADMIQDHRMDIEKFQEQAQDGDNHDVAMLAQNTLPTLQKHLDIAQSIS